METSLLTNPNGPPKPEESEIMIQLKNQIENLTSKVEILSQNSSLKSPELVKEERKLKSQNQQDQERKRSTIKDIIYAIIIFIRSLF